MLRYHIQTIEVGAGGAANIVFSSIPQTYTDLFLVFSFRQETSTGASVYINPNQLTTNQSTRYLEGDGATRASGTLARIFTADTPSNATASTFSNSVVYIPNYAGNTNKSFSIDTVTENNATTAYQRISAGLWSVTTAITSLEIIQPSGDIAEYSSASLYGIRRGSDGRTEVASGGTITTSGGYTIHTFNSSGTFVANRDMDVEYLVIAGGGGSGTDSGAGVGWGGGGAGGYRSSVVGESSGGGASAEQKIRVNSGNSYTVTVGAGGSGGNSPTSGSDSIFGPIVSVGGGRAGGYRSTIFIAQNGGSGGGGAYFNGTAGLGIANQGYNGGTGFSNFESGAGGGGAGAVGQNAQTTGGGAGGNGVASLITGTSITRAGGGGGGGGATKINGGTGGTGGGGNGGGPSDSTAGSANTGGGGGGGDGLYSRTGKAGGSGVVIIRYLTPA